MNSVRQASQAISNNIFFSTEEARMRHRNLAFVLIKASKSNLMTTGCWGKLALKKAYEMIEESDIY